MTVCFNLMATYSKVSRNQSENKYVVRITGVILNVFLVHSEVMMVKYTQ